MKDDAKVKTEARRGVAVFIPRSSFILPLSSFLD
jgi:hypothetical protein